MKKIFLEISILIILLGLIVLVNPFKSKAANSQPVESIKTGSVSRMITASGDIEANQANLTFLAAGRVAYLGVKNNDRVQNGQVLASLDTTIPAHGVSAAEAQYRSAEAVLAKVIDDIRLKEAGGDPAQFANIHENQTEKTQRQQAEEAVNVAYDNLQSARQNLALQSIIAPFDGTVLSIQNIAEGTNVSPASGSNITILGGGNLKFVADINEPDINQIHIGQAVTVKLDGSVQTLKGTISKIAAGSITLPDGRNVFKADIQCANLTTNTQAGQTGSVEVSTDQGGGILVPSWTVLGNKYIWVSAGGKMVLKEVRVGSTFEGRTSIISGIDINDQVILDPEVIAKYNYPLL